MRKAIISISAAVVMIVSCLFGFTAFAEEPTQEVKTDISAAQVTITSLTNIGNQPSFTVKLDNVTLKKNVDFTYTVSNNDKLGYKKAKLKISGQGNYTGSKTVKFNIYPSKVNGVKAKDVKQNSLTLSWNSKSKEGVSGYKVYRATSAKGEKKLIKTTSSTKITVKGLDSAQKYYFYVAAYKKSSDKTLIGELSSARITCTKPGQTKLNCVTVKNSKKINADWDKVHNANGYQIKYSKDRALKKGVKVINVSGKNGDKTIKVPGTKQAYFLKVRAYKTYSVNGKKKTVYGPWSVKMSSIFGRVYKQYTTNYPSNKNRTTNLKLACKAINGTIVYPGETFSFNKTVGIRTAKKGYKPAVVFKGSTSQAKEVGGGICQVASTMYNAALLSNFGIVERHQHSQKVSYCPLGRDAAIYWGSCDFKFKNNTNYPIKIVMNCSNGKLTCTYMVSYKIKAPKVKLSVSRSGKNYTLKRRVNGKVNYTAHSYY